MALQPYNDILARKITKRGFICVTVRPEHVGVSETIANHDYKY